MLIIDPGCYSTTDMFAAGFQDHEIGKTRRVGGHTGAGGASGTITGLPARFSRRAAQMEWYLAKMKPHKESVVRGRSNRRGTGPDKRLLGHR